MSAISFISLLCAVGLNAQTTQWPPYPAGMRLVVGSQGALVRNTPSLTGTCGSPAHTCTAADGVLAGVFGVVQINPPVHDTNGFWWVYMVFDTGVKGWVTGYPPYLNMLNPIQMSTGFSFRVVGDYNGPTITSALCLNDGVQSNATMALQAIPGATGQQGTLSCSWGMPGVGNHKAVIRAINGAGTASSEEFQFVVNTQVVQQVPNAPGNLRIGPLDTSLPVAAEAEAEEKKKEK